MATNISFPPAFDTTNPSATTVKVGNFIAFGMTDPNIDILGHLRDSAGGDIETIGTTIAAPPDAPPGSFAVYFFGVAKGDYFLAIWDKQALKRLAKIKIHVEPGMGFGGLAITSPAAGSHVGSTFWASGPSANPPFNVSSAMTGPNGRLVVGQVMYQPNAMQQAWGAYFDMSSQTQGLQWTLSASDTNGDVAAPVPNLTVP